MKSIHIIIIGDEILSGRREDKHFAFVRECLAKRHLMLSGVHYVGDDTRELLAVLRQSFDRSNSITFSFGGIGATPDDKTRQAVAAALALPLIRHPQAVTEIEAQFGEGAYPIRVRMADLPEGCTLIPNPVNRVAGFSIRDHHFLPGFPQMAWSMMQWVLDTHYPDLVGETQVVEKIIIEGQSESLWVDWMENFERQFPTLKLFSLPHLGEDGSRQIELGCVGLPEIAQQGRMAMIQEANNRQVVWH